MLLLPVVKVTGITPQHVKGYFALYAGKANHQVNKGLAPGNGGQLKTPLALTGWGGFFFVPGSWGKKKTAKRNIIVFILIFNIKASRSEIYKHTVRLIVWVS